MNKCSRLEKIINYIVKSTFLIIVVMLFLCSICGNAYVDSKEHTGYCQDNILINMLSIIAVILISTLVVGKHIRVNKKVVIVGIVIWSIACIVWILMTRLQPRADQKYTLDAALQMRAGDFSSLKDGGYLYIHPHQYGLTLYFYTVSFLFNENTFLGVQFINIIALLATFLAMYKTMEIFHNNRNISKCTILALLAFIPMAMYITFVYGNIMGLSCSVLAVMFEMYYLKSERKRYIFAFASLISISVIFKSNYLITMVAMIVVLILETIFRRKIKYVIPIIAIILCYVLGNYGVKCTMKLISNIDSNDGTPNITYVAMGMQEGNMAPGWYNGYNKKVYVKNDYNSEIAKEKALESIRESMNKFKSEPQYTAKFYSEKITSQWNNPTFQSIWINLGRKSVGVEKNRIVKSIIKERKLGKALIFYMNIIQTIILFGTVGYFIINYTKIGTKELIYAIIFIGGFVFHLIWEAKCQYTITYFILLIPYSILGYRAIGEKFVKLYNLKSKKLKSIGTKDIIKQVEQ